ncbi:MAG: S46 family peptidase [Lewinellaceae bacterium]|nr:S46 family peptidase [Phaeodactylibacter sp.]MCB9351516.1 S46 family peptidase [Lewinellaceae bacterium]
MITKAFQKLPLVLSFLLFSAVALLAQPAATYYESDVEVSRFDYGKMWAFEYAPTDYFKETYNFQPDEAWWERARMASLRFASWCSASFISPDGLVLTNHHCSHGEAGKVAREGEDLDATGFYAKTADEERRVPGLFVKQLVKIADITEYVRGFTGKAASDEEMVAKEKEALKSAMEEYSSKAGWEGLEVETVTYFSGGRFSMYGYKRYDDVRLVLLPELRIGNYGGDPDNFTYPRYNLDMTLWRVYENGQPVNSSDFYFPVKPEGAAELEAVFTIGNPGSTERYRTMAQLEYDRDYRYKILKVWLHNRLELMREQYEANPSPGMLDQILNFSNSDKAIGGILDALHDPEMMGKKKKMEELIKAKSKAVAQGNDFWKALAEDYQHIGSYKSENFLLAPNPMNGVALQLAYATYGYSQALEAEAPEEELNGLRAEIKTLAASLNEPYEEKLLALLLEELQSFALPGDDYIGQVLKGRTPAVAAREILAETQFGDEKQLEKLLDAKAKKFSKSKDPIIRLGSLFVPEYEESQLAFQTGSASRQALAGKIGNEVYQVYGLAIPPDATFTLRMADGVVKGYEYNGTEAPVKTTYFGLYDRHYSNDGAYPWDLPQRWSNPPKELLRSPLNFISTCDSTGGNSGSPMINKKGELVGLLFDGNIESLAGNYIYDVEYNRSIGVHAGGITAALKYIYDAGRILKELGVE